MQNAEIDMCGKILGAEEVVEIQPEVGIQNTHRYVSLRICRDLGILQSLYGSGHMPKRSNVGQIQSGRRSTHPFPEVGVESLVTEARAGSLPRQRHEGPKRC